MTPCTPGQVRTLPEPVCPKCGEPRPSCVCEKPEEGRRVNDCVCCNGTGFAAGVLDEPCDNCTNCEVCGKLSPSVHFCPYCFEEHCTDCITECPREVEG